MEKEGIYPSKSWVELLKLWCEKVQKLTGITTEIKFAMATGGRCLEFTIKGQL